MTLDEFVEKLSQIKGWRLTKKGLLRHRRYYCPLFAVAELSGGARTWGQMENRLRLPRATANLVMEAADNHRTDRVLELRARLLKACGL